MIFINNKLYLLLIKNINPIKLFIKNKNSHQ